MDLSAVIFVVLALAWAVYLIPKALKHHDEVASDRLVEGHSDKVRILSRTRTTTVATTETVVEDTDQEAEDTESAVRRHETAPETAPGAGAETGDVVRTRPARTSAVPTRASARRAARNRRRVLGVLAVLLAVVVGLAASAVLPWAAVAAPVALVVAFLVVARVSVRRQQQARRVTGSATSAERLREATAAAERSAAAARHDVGHPRHVDVTEQALQQLADDAPAEDRQELEAALADDGSLWDPLPMTLPTYVNKARARRTVRTIELTGISSSGHDESDSAMARGAEQEAAEASADSPRKVVGG